MKKQKQNQDQRKKKLSLIKLQLSKINNTANIHGGGVLQMQLADNGDDKCIFPEDASNPVDHGVKTPTQ